MSALEVAYGWVGKDVVDQAGPEVVALADQLAYVAASACLDLGGNADLQDQSIRAEEGHMAC
jgi:hypothetical protein